MIVVRLMNMVMTDASNRDDHHVESITNDGRLLTESHLGLY